MKTRSLAPGAVVALLAAVGVLLAAGGWFAVVQPQRHEAAAAADQVTSIEQQIAKLQAAAAASGDETVAKQPTIRTADLYRITKAMPSTEDQPDLLLELDQVARAAGVTVLTIAPLTPVPGNGFTTVPITVTATGDFYGLTDLLYRLRALVAVRHGALDATGRLFSVSSVQLSPTGTGKTLTADLTVDAYVYGSTAPAATTPTSTSTTSTSTTDTTTTNGAPTTGVTG